MGKLLLVALEGLVQQPCTLSINVASGLASEPEKNEVERIGTDKNVEQNLE